MTANTLVNPTPPPVAYSLSSPLSSKNGDLNTTVPNLASTQSVNDLIAKNFMTDFNDESEINARYPYLIGPILSCILNHVFLFHCY